MQMGVAGGIIAAGTMAIQQLFKWLNKANDDVKKLGEAFAGQVKDGIAKTKEQIDKLIGSYDKLLGKMKKSNDRDSIGRDVELSKMQEQAKRDIAGTSGEERAKKELEWTKKIEEYKEQTAKKNLENVKKEITLKQREIQEAKDAQSLAFGEYKSKNKRAVDVGNSDASNAEKIDAANKAQVAKKKYEQYEPALQKMQEELEALTTKRIKAEADVTKQVESSKTARLEAELKIIDEQTKSLEQAEKEWVEKQKKQIKEKEEKEKALKQQELEAKKKLAKENKDKEIEHYNELNKKLGEGINKLNSDIANWLNGFNNGGKGGGFNGRDKGKGKMFEIKDDNGNVIAERSMKDQRAFEIAKRELDRLNNTKGLNSSMAKRREQLQKWVDANDPNNIAKMIRERQMKEKERDANIKAIADAVKQGIGL